MKRHASADELADLAAGVLKPRKAGKISGHLSGCAFCTDVSNQLANVSSLLATVPVAPMPASLSSRIETAIAAESAQRLASEPVTEAGRRDLPGRGRRPRPSGQGWRIPLLSGPASRLVAAAGALVIIGGGGYEIAAHIGATTGTTASSGAGAGAVHVPTRQQSYGPSITYPQGATTKSLPSVTSDTNFTGPMLGKQAAAALATVRSHGVVPSPAPNRASQASPQNSGLRLGANVPSSDQLTGCVDMIAHGQQVLLVELAYFDSRPATIIVIASAKSGAAEVWAVGRGCSATTTEVLSHVRVAHI